MKISMDKVANYYNSVQNKNKPAAKERVSQASGRNFDEIMIHTSSRKVEEGQFADQMSQKVMDRVMDKTSEDKIQRLRTQAEEGRYQVDAGLIASKILLQEDRSNA